MHVVLGATCLRPNGAGTTTYVRGLLESLPDSQRCRTTVVVQADATTLVPADMKVKTVPVSSGSRRAIVNKLARSPGELFHSLDVDLPLGWRGPTVATIHDLSVFDVPWTGSSFRSRGEQLLLRHAARRADTLIAVSDFTAERIRHWLHREAVVVPIAPAPELRPATPDEVAAVRERHNLPGEFVLHVGTIEPRKNVPRLAAACQRAGVPLLLAGSSWQGDLELAGDVRRLGYVPAEELPALYGAATLTAYVSVYEGFGLPPVEAMSCGAAVVCSPVASLRPLLGQDAAEWADPADVDDIARALTLVLRDADRRAALIGAGRSAAASLSFAETAQRTMAVWQHLS